jgi:hypothetical protein
MAVLLIAHGLMLEIINDSLPVASLLKKTKY